MSAARRWFLVAAEQPAASTESRNDVTDPAVKQASDMHSTAVPVSDSACNRNERTVLAKLATVDGLHPLSETRWPVRKPVTPTARSVGAVRAANYDTPGMTRDSFPSTASRNPGIISAVRRR